MDTPFSSIQADPCIEPDQMVSFIPPSDDKAYAEIIDQWVIMLDRNDHLDALYQSPEWVNHLRTVNLESELYIVVVRGSDGAILEIAPIRYGRYFLKYEVSARTLLKIPMNAVYLLGSQPIASDDSFILKQLFHAIWERFPDCQCIYMDSVPTDSNIWKMLYCGADSHEDAILYNPDGVRPYHSLEIPESLDEYLSRFKSKKRYNIQRQVKALTQFGGGNLQLVRIEFVDQVDDFMKGAVSVARRSWQQQRIGSRIDDSIEWRNKLTDLAERQLLRSYLLTCNGNPCAFVYGYQYKDVYHYVEIAYDESYAKYSPGVALLFLLIEDLILHRRPARMNFGVGDALYKREFGSIHAEDASILLMRRDTVTWSIQASHAMFQKSKLLVKKVLRRKE